MSKNKKMWTDFRKKIEDDINWAGLKEQLDDTGKKKDTHFDKLRKVKDQINKQKEKIGKIDVTDPKQRTPHAIATADLKSMNLKLKDMQVTDNEPETDDKGKPNKKNYIKEEPLNEGMKIANLVGQSIAHLGMYVELAEDIKKEYFKTNLSMFIKAKADQVSKNVPKLIKELRRPGIWNEQVEKADNAVKFWEDKQLDETAYTDWLKKAHSKELRQLGVSDIKKYADLWSAHKEKQFQTARMGPRHIKWIRNKSPIAAELEPDTIKKEEVVREVSPPGWEGTVRAMKKHPELGGEKGDKNIYALSWYLKNKGAKSHYKDKGGKPVKKDKYKSEEKIKVNEGYDEDVHFGISGLETDRQTIEEEIQMDKKYLKTRTGSVEDSINKIRVEQPTVKIEKPKVTLQTKSYFDQKEGSLADAAAKVVSEDSNVKYKVVDAKTKKPISDKSLSYNAALHMKKQKGDGYEVKSVDAFGKVVSEEVIKEDGSLIKKAIEIAKKMANNYTGATKAIEALKKGLSKNPDVSAALLKANEEIKIEARSPEEQKKQDKMMKDFLAKGGKVKKLKPGIAKGAGYLDHRGEYKKDMLAASAVYKAPTTKYKKTTLAAQKSFKDLRSETDQKEVEKDLVASKHGGKGKTLTGKTPAVIDTEPKVNPI